VVALWSLGFVFAVPPSVDRLHDRESTTGRRMAAGTAEPITGINV
jgi:hypothetical protein